MRVPVASKHLLVVFSASLSLSACVATSPRGSDASGPLATVVDQSRLDRVVPGLIDELDVAGVGIAVIRDGKLAWSGYYGEMAPGRPADARTVFNTASVAKTVTAETLLTLAAKGLISLDEQVGTEYVHPDLAEDPRYALLTPRLLLSHRSGLLNWPYLYDDGRLAFVREPGTAFGYSGIGVELAARYAESKLGRDFETLAFEHVLEPLGVEEMSMGNVEPWMKGRLATPMNEQGEFVDPREKPYSWSGPSFSGERHVADNLLTTIEAYADFMIGTLSESSAASSLADDRSTILTSLAEDDVWGCDPAVVEECPTRHGYGIGWMVYEFAGRTILKHGGNDQGENALVFYSPETGDGAVIFVNGGNGFVVAVQILDLVGEGQLASYYRDVVRRAYDVALEPLN